MTAQFFVLLASWVGLAMLVFYMAGLLREQRGRAMVAEQYAVDLSDQLSHMMKQRAVEWDEDDDSGISVLTVTHINSMTDTELDDWLMGHPGVNPVRERGGQG